MSIRSNGNGAGRATGTRTPKKSRGGYPPQLAMMGGRESLGSLSPWFWCFLAAAILLRTFPFGIRYFPVLDDNNMYGVFSTMRIPEVFHTYPDFILTRPFAVLFDVLFISRLWPVSWLVLGFMAVMLWGMLWLLERTSRALSLPVGPFGLVFLALDPFGLEATWWLAASSRVLAGLFLSFLALYLLLPLLGIGDREPRRPVLRGFAYAGVHLLSLGFYEQCTLVSLFLSGMVILFCARGAKKRLWLAVPLLNAILMGGWYLVNAGKGNLADRGGLVRDNLVSHIRTVLGNLSRKLFPEHLGFIGKTVRAGFSEIWPERWWLMVAVVLLAAGIAWFSTRRGGSPAFRAGPFFLKLGIGLALLFVPVALFFVLANGWIANRNLFPSLLGLALLLDAPMEALAGLRGWKVLPRVLAGIMAAAFLIGGISEVRDYRAVSEIDRRVTKGFVEVLRQEEPRLSSVDRVLLFNTRERYPNLAAPHFSNCTAVGWALAGAVRADYPEGPYKSPETVRDGAMLPVGTELDRCLLMGIDEKLHMQTLTAGKADHGGMIRLQDEQGKLFGELRPEGTGLIFVRTKP